MNTFLYIIKKIVYNTGYRTRDDDETKYLQQ